jgi:hypothetical protein
MREASGRLSDLVLVRLHGRAAAYLAATDAERAELVAACRREATVGDLAERILARTIYAQASSRSAPLRELIQNAIDASPRGGRVDVRTGISADGAPAEIIVSDRGSGMTQAELLSDLLVPFRSGKQDDPDAIGEHGIGFLSALEIAPRLEVTTTTATAAYRLSITPVGARPPYADFEFDLDRVDAARRPCLGTSVRLSLDRPIAPSALVEEIFAIAGFVESAAARIFVDGEPINTVRARLRKVACVPIGGGAFGELTLLAGRGDRITPRFSLTQKGLLVSAHLEPFGAPELSLHRDLLASITAAGYGLVADLPLAVPLTKGRAAPAAMAQGAVVDAIAAAFERFVLEDALYDRELLRGVDHRLAAVLDRLVATALRGEEPPPDMAPRAAATEDERPPNAPTVAAPEAVVRFASALVDAPMFSVITIDPDAPGRPQRRHVQSLRCVVDAHRRGVLRAMGYERELAIGMLYLGSNDPLAQALFRRLTLPIAEVRQDAARARPTQPMPRVARDRLLTAAEVPGVRALSAALAILERVDAAISIAAGLAPSVMSAHQDLYGPDEMAHTDGAGISVNLASARIRALLSAALASDDPAALAALVDLVLHEKAHVALASYVPRSCAEHGQSFYRKKEQLRRRLLEAIAEREVVDPMASLASIREGLPSFELPDPAALAAAFNPPLAA